MAALVKTQKALGFQALSHVSRNCLRNTTSPIVGGSGAKILPYEVPSGLSFPLFARPCPKTPRHGFVESRAVKSMEELLTVFIEARLADPEAEVIAMPVLSGRYSAVATDAGVTWGLGNDGVTGNTSKILRPIPCKGRLTESIREATVGMDLGLKTAAYVEAVEHNGNVEIVQVRDGPAVEAGIRNWVPEAGFKVERIVSAAGTESDLLAWEEMCQKFPRGTVVHLPGGSLSSHHAVHGIINKHAVWLDKDAPAIGATLEPESGQAKPLTQSDYNKMARFYRQVRRTVLNNGQSSIAHLGNQGRLGVSILHSMSMWSNAPHLIRFRVLGPVYLARMMAAACLGEDRHFYRCGPGSNRRHASKVDWSAVFGRPPKEWKTKTERIDWQSSLVSVNRADVFIAVTKLPLTTLLPAVEGVIADFAGNWTGNVCACERCLAEQERMGKVGYGGPKWRKSAEQLRDLLRALEAFSDNPSAETWKAVLGPYNNCTYLVHNGGTLASKITSNEDMNRAAVVPQVEFLSPLAMKLIFLPKAYAKEFKSGGVVAFPGKGKAKPPLEKQDIKASKHPGFTATLLPPKSTNGAKALGIWWTSPTGPVWKGLGNIPEHVFDYWHTIPDEHPIKDPDKVPGVIEWKGQKFLWSSYGSGWKWLSHTTEEPLVWPGKAIAFGVLDGAGKYFRGDPSELATGFFDDEPLKPAPEMPETLYSGPKYTLDDEACDEERDQ